MLRRSQLRRKLNLGHEAFRKLELAGELPAPLIIAGMKRWPVDEVEAWIARQPRWEVSA